MKKINVIAFILLFVIGFSCNSEKKSNENTTINENIRFNQVGFYPESPKIAILTQEAKGKFFVFDSETKDTVFTGNISESQAVEMSFKQTCVLDFSGLKTEGTFYIDVPGKGISASFKIAKNVNSQLGDAVLKSFYFQRMSTALTEEFAGKWSHEFGHPDTNVLVHASAASAARPEGTILSAPLGWYDAGDYNKYIVNSGVTTGTMFSLYEDFPDFFAKRNGNIPESKNNLPDIIDEILWNLRWMIKMQDPNDGGVYHKLTTANFEGFVMPKDAVNQRYVVQKGTAAALNFTAVMAQASRILKSFDSELPGLSDSCLKAAENAWAWAKKNPKIAYEQNKINETYEPKINTGAYDDLVFDDEFFWAAAELYTTTQKAEYLKFVQNNLAPAIDVQGWNQVRIMGYFSLIRNEKELADITDDEFALIKNKVIAFAEKLIEGIDKAPFRAVMGRDDKDYVWGSNAVAANQGVVLLNAYKISLDKKFYNAALANLDYLLGKNATNYCFVTGFGNKQVMNIHHRPSGADGIKEPVPGFLAGGPNPGQQDGLDYPFDSPAESYVDLEASYASNEIAINWQAPLAYLVFGLEIME